MWKACEGCATPVQNCTCSSQRYYFNGFLHHLNLSYKKLSLLLKSSLKSRKAILYLLNSFYVDLIFKNFPLFANNCFYFVGFFLGGEPAEFSAREQQGDGGLADEAARGLPASRLLEVTPLLYTFPPSEPFLWWCAVYWCRHRHSADILSCRLQRCQLACCAKVSARVAVLRCNGAGAAGLHPLGTPLVRPARHRPALRQPGHRSDQVASPSPLCPSLHSKFSKDINM